MNKTAFFLILCFHAYGFSAAESAASSNQKARTTYIIKLTARAKQLLLEHTHQTAELLGKDKQVPEPPKTEPDTFKHEDLFMFIFGQPNK